MARYGRSMSPGACTASLTDGEEHFEMLDFGVPDICTFKRRTAGEDAAAALRAQQQCQLEMQRERAQQLAAAMQLKKKTQKANGHCRAGHCRA